jgi:hypothetical protein
MALLLTSQRLHTIIWVLVYGGLLTLVLGLSVQRSDDDLGWSMVAAGLVVALMGFALVFVRARMKAD